jgi:uncharacterized protein
VIIVADASPLISLARIGRLTLLPALYDSVQIPRAVHREIIRRPPGFQGGLPAWIQVSDVRDRAAVAALVEDLGAGESEAIVLATELGLPLLIDDGAGRAVARARGLQVTGTLGMLLEARRAGLIERVRPLTDQLRAVDFRADEALIESILREAGEI